MTITETIYHKIRRYRSLQTNRVMTLPVVILMPHSSCNCRCVMCDIWKDNANLKQLTENDILSLLNVFKKYGTKQVLMSGGEAMLHPNFFRFCEILNKHNISVSLLSTGLTLKKNAAQITRNVHDVIVSLDGDEATHDLIRNIPQAYQKLKEGVQAVKSLQPGFRITARTVIHRLNYRVWDDIIRSAKEAGIDQISFLPADVSSHAFNREVLWSDKRQHEILPGENELPELKIILERIIENHKKDFESGYIAENPAKLRKIYEYYSAFYGQNAFPYKKCNAPWISTVIEADGTVRPCFFHQAIGNIRENELDSILNSAESIRFRRELDINKDATCEKCVCYLYL